MLIQIDKVKAYSTRKLNVHENNYPTHNLEPGAVMFALKIWRHNLYVFYVDVFTDHTNLLHVFAHKELNLRHRRRLVFLKDYDMSVPYEHIIAV